MRNVLGRPLDEALSSLPAGEKIPRITLSAAPLRKGQQPREGTERVIACREGEWITARFWDQLPRENEDA